MNEEYHDVLLKAETVEKRNTRRPIITQYTPIHFGVEAMLVGYACMCSFNPKITTK